MIAGGKYALTGLDQGFVDLVAHEFQILCKYPDPTSKMGEFLMAIQKASDVWVLAKAAIENEVSLPPPETE